MITNLEQSVKAGRGSRSPGLVIYDTLARDGVCEYTLAPVQQKTGWPAAAATPVRLYNMLRR